MDKFYNHCGRIEWASLRDGKETERTHFTLKQEISILNTHEIITKIGHMLGYK